MLIIDNISIHYKTKEGVNQTVQDLSFQLEKGQALAILGPSGCGKSTLINALAGSIPITRGKVDFILDAQHKCLNPRTHKIGIIPQNYGLLPWKTIKENCLLALKIRKEPITPSHQEEINNIFDALNIQSTLNKYPRELSGGQVQRAAIARAFILQPDLLLMDEPFSALDEITKEEARELFIQVWNRRKPTTILVTHSIEEALYLGNKIFVMGSDGGHIKYHMDNPYFGHLYPDNLDYLVTKQTLRFQLNANRKKEGYHE